MLTKAEPKQNMEKFYQVRLTVVAKDVNVATIS